MLPYGPSVHLHKSASFKMLFLISQKYIKNMMLKLFPKRSNNPFENYPKHDSEKQLKISSKGSPEAPKRESKVAQRRRKAPKAPPGPPRNSDCDFLVSLTRPRRPHDLPKPARGSQKLLPKIFQTVNEISKSITRPHLHNT